MRQSARLSEPRQTHIVLPCLLPHPQFHCLRIKPAPQGHEQSSTRGFDDICRNGDAISLERRLAQSVLQTFTSSPVTYQGIQHIPHTMANPPRPWVDNINGFDTYGSIDADDTTLYNNLPDDPTRNAFLALMRWLLQIRGRDLPRGCPGRKVVAQWNKKRRYWEKKRPPGQPAATAVAPGAAPLVAPPPPLPIPPPPVLPVAGPPALPEADDNDASAASSEVSSGERSPTFFLQNNPERKRFLAPTAGQRKAFYNHDNGRWKFAMTLHQTRLDDGKRRFSQGSMPRKSVYLCVRTNSTGEIEEVSQIQKAHPDGSSELF